jgi:hypothetical protein
MGSQCCKTSEISDKDLETNKYKQNKIIINNISNNDYCKQESIKNTINTERPIKQINTLNDSKEDKINGSADLPYDYDQHSRNILKALNKIRNKPHKYINKIYDLVKTINEQDNSIFLARENIKIFLPENLQPLDAIAFLQKTSSKNAILWSSLICDRAMESIINNRANTKLGDVEITSTPKKNGLKRQNTFKIQADFIVSPKMTVYIMLMISEENRKIMFSNDIAEGAVITFPSESIESFTNEGSTLFILVEEIINTSL